MLSWEITMNIPDITDRFPWIVSEEHATTGFDLSQTKVEHLQGFVSPFVPIEHALPTKEAELQKLIRNMTFSFPEPGMGILSKGLSPEASIGSTETFPVAAIRKDFPLLQRKVNGHPLIWLDNGATTQKPLAVINAVDHFYKFENSNIHRGAHHLARDATNIYENTRIKLAKFFNARTEKEIVFVRGATEAINLVAQTYGKKYIKEGDEILVSMLEHHSNILPWRALCEETGAKLIVIPINTKGDILLDQYENLLNGRTKLVAITHVSNALGTLTPVQEMIQMAHRYGATVLVDGAQSAPHLPVDLRSLDCEFFVVSGHKLFAPTGIGFLYGKQEILDQLPPWQQGGGMIESVSFEAVKYAPAPYRFEAGTGHISGVAGLGAAIDYLSKIGMQHIAAYEEKLMEYALAKLPTIPGVNLIGLPHKRVAAVSFVIQNYSTQKIGQYLDSCGIALRVGHHCAQPALRFFNLSETIRPSFSFYNSIEEVDALISALHSFIHRTK